MKKLLTLFIAGLAFSACNQGGTSNFDDEVAIDTYTDSASYLLAMDYSSWLKERGVKDLNYELFVSTMKGQLDGDSIDRIDQMAGTTFMRAFYMDLEEKRIKEMEAEYQDNKDEAMAWLEAKASEEGVQKLVDGLYYRVLKEGTGPTPMSSDVVSVLYKGTFIDGSIFDQTEGEPRQFQANRVIQGWAMALQQMPVGSKWELFISPDLAYGLKPDPRSGIPPQSALYFEVELLEIVTPE